MLKSALGDFKEIWLFNPNSGKSYITDTLQRLWEKACKAVSVDIELYQATRHSVASMAASSGVSIAIIKEVLGHTDIRTTQKYSHVNVLSQSQVFAAQDKGAGSEGFLSKRRSRIGEKKRKINRR